MKTLFGFGTVMALAMTAMACSKTPDASTSSTLEVTGTVNTRLRSLDNASAIAIGSDGRTFSAYIAKNGRFKLSLPVGHVYRIVVANSTMAGELRTVGHLVNPTSAGKADVIAVKRGGKLNLGTLKPAGAKSNTLHTACDCAPSADGSSDKPAPAQDDSGYGDDKGSADPSGDKSVGDKGDPSDDAGDDYKCVQKDADKDRVCEDSTDVELEADNAPGDQCAKDGDDEEAPQPTSKACTAKDADKDGKDDAPSPDKGEASGGGYGGGADDKSAPSEDQPASPPSSGACKCSLECGPSASCVASKCVDDASSEPSAKP